MNEQLLFGSPVIFVFIYIVTGEDHFHSEERYWTYLNDSAHESEGNVNQIEQLLFQLI